MTLRRSVTALTVARAVPAARADQAGARSEAARDVRRGRRLAGYKPSGDRVVAGHDRGAVSLFAFFPRNKYECPIHPGMIGKITVR